MKAATLGSIGLSLLLLATALPGQCFNDDGFSVPGACCVPIPIANLPVFPQATIPSDGACFLDCNVEAVFPVTINLQPPIFIFCDLYLIPFNISGSVNTGFTFLVAKYSRTWLDFSIAGTAKQVWRFMVNADVNYLPPLSPPCPTPACAAAGLPVHLVGSIDYVQDCGGTPTWEVAINLTHLCGDMAHGSFTQRFTTSANHPERVFAFVGPSPFNFSAPVSIGSNMLIADAERSTSGSLSPFNWVCYSEQPISFGQIVNQTQACPCATSSSAPPRWDLLDLRLNYDCVAPANTNYQSLPWAPVIPTGLSAFPLGTYATPPGTYTFNQSVSTLFGLALGFDNCAGNFPIHFVYGTATGGGGFISLFNHPVGFQNAIDLVNSKVLTNSPPFIQLIGYGSLFVSTMLWSANY